MIDKLIDVETANIACIKGFKSGSLYNYHRNSKVLTETNKHHLYFNLSNNDYWEAPSQSLLQKWLRDNYNLHIVIIPTINSYWTFKIVHLTGTIEVPPYNNVDSTDYNSYEEALEVALQRGLNLIK